MWMFMVGTCRNMVNGLQTPTYDMLQLVGTILYPVSTNSISSKSLAVYREEPPVVFVVLCLPIRRLCFRCSTQV